MKSKADVWDFQTGFLHTSRRQTHRGIGQQPSAASLVQDVKVPDDGLSEEVTRESWPKHRVRSVKGSWLLDPSRQDGLQVEGDRH